MAHTKTLLACCFLATLSFTIESRPPDGHGGEPVQADHAHDHMSAETRRAIEIELHESAQRLHAAGILPATRTRGAITPGSLTFPLRAREGLDFDQYFGISNFVDLAPAFGAVQDYHCGARSYDLPGYNHAGVDYFLYPFQWRMMDMEIIEIVAAAPGVILGKHDGNDDRSCDAGTAADWNAVYIEHSDGSVAWYGHMKKDSLTGKNIGDTVEQGEFLGLVGSSGRSSGPHLHFELRTSNLPGADIYEPHAGECNTTIEASLWEEQPTYYEPGWYGVGVHNALPVTWGCYGVEQDNLSDAIALGAPVWFTIHFKDLLPGQAPFMMRLFGPDGALYHSWEFSHAESVHYPSAWYYWTWTSLGEHPDLEGDWVFEAEWQGQIARRGFYHGELPLFEDRFENP